MSRKFIGLVAAVSIAITGFAAAPARAGSDEDFAKILAGIIVLGTVAAAIESNKKKKRARARDYDTPRVDHDRGHRPRGHRRNARRLPADCLRVTNTRNGRMRYFASRCLQRNYRHADRLPRFCRTRVERANGRVARGYNASCLRNEGYRIARN